MKVLRERKQRKAASDWACHQEQIAYLMEHPPGECIRCGYTEVFHGRENGGHGYGGYCCLAFKEGTVNRIVIAGGDVFDGSPEQFAKCFFTNVDELVIKDWAEQNGWDVEFHET